MFKPIDISAFILHIITNNPHMRTEYTKPRQGKRSRAKGMRNPVPRRRVLRFGLYTLAWYAKGNVVTLLYADDVIYQHSGKRPMEVCVNKLNDDHLLQLVDAYADTFDGRCFTICVQGNEHTFYSLEDALQSAIAVCRGGAARESATIHCSLFGSGKLLEVFPNYIDNVIRNYIEVGVEADAH